ncbi:RimJ/RimL family protein N-acetyltransferase [Rhodovulum bhavnagarense]|uniref:RimJ/RimL family protein N-acetyltransferase n=1 Tax=Rhodovulum bhavnagarense TaxID=992286 RepID=A0A4R2RLY7_9RHOB|nr:GNAT family protein [Rhodovulum bhavnagarense]TCP63267.1 RimJ/RimL family protein N-acetyltransferase [Rhodovulum bhavnagarense]
MTGSIRPARRDDFPFIHAIAARPENARFILDEDDAALAAHIAAPDRDLVIWEQDGAAQGFALFAEIGNPAGRVELRRLALASPDTGMGKPLLRALIAHGFDRLGARRIWLDVAGDNLRAQKTYARAGFVHEGTLRRHWGRPAGDIADLMLYGLLREEWRR